MDDRIAELREALSSFVAGDGGPDYEVPYEFEVIYKAARERLAELESDALIIRRDENGKWPTSAIAAFEYAFEGDESDFGIVELCTQILDALASSQGVEP